MERDAIGLKTAPVERFEDGFLRGECGVVPDVDDDDEGALLSEDMLEMAAQ